MKAVIFTHVLYLTLLKTFMVKGVSECESKVELRAVLLSCPPRDSGCDDDDPLSQAMRAEESRLLHADSKNFEALLEEKERGFPSAVKECKRKLVITLKVKNVGKIPCDDEYIVVDHVYDPVTGGRGRLLSPVVVKLRQEQMVQVYGLQFQRVVNSDPFEEQKAGEKTCSVGPDDPTCGIAMYDGKPIPFSEGFCCSCDPRVNGKRQVSPASRGDSLPHGDSELVSPGNPRILPEDEPGAIVDPELVQLKSGSSKGASGGKKGLDRSRLADPLVWEKVPNFLLEHDRKVICDRGDLMGELCKLRQQKIEEESDSEIYRGPTPRSREKSVAAGAAADAPGDGRADDAAALESFVKALNADRATNSASPADGRGPGKGSRGKRENRRESRKLTLEEKLDRFASSKKRVTNRRKRLLELSHRRWRKAEDRRGASPRASGKSCGAEECCRPPPRYFFSHDKTIIDPLEPTYAANATCKPEGKTVECSEKTLRQSGKSEKFDRGYEDDVQEKIGDRSFYRRQQKIEEKPGRKDKMVGKLNGKTAKVMRIEGGRMESGVTRGRETGPEDLNEILEAASVRDEKRFESFRGAEKKEGEEEDAEGGQRGGDDQKYGSKNGKSFFHKGEGERKFAKPRIRNFFTSKNREKQKLRSEFSKSHKKGEARHREKPGNGDFENDELRGKKEEDSEKEREGFGGGEPGGSSALRFTTEMADVGLRQFPPSLEPAEEKQGYAGERKHSKASLEKKAQENRFRPLKDLEGNINFNVEIIRDRPGVTKYRHPEQFAKSARGDAATLGLKTNIYSLTGRAQYMKSKPSSLLPYSPSQNLYFVDGAEAYPQEAFLAVNENGRYPEAKSRPRLDAVFQGRTQPSYAAHPHRKPNRRHYVPLVHYSEGGADARRAGQPLLPNRGEGLREAQPRAKRHSEPPPGRPDARRSESGKARSKRSTAYSFQPALGFYESEFDSRKADRHIVHALETCPEEEKARKREPAAGLHFSRAKQENFSADSNLISSLRELRSRLGHWAFASLETSKRERNGKAASDKQRLIRSYLNAPDYVLEEAESALTGRREADEGRKAEDPERGAACRSEHARDTAHCMRFGDLWYGLYTIKRPVVSQSVGVQLFDKHSLCDGTTQWRDLTKGKTIRVGTFFSKAEDELPTMSLTFVGDQHKKVEGAIDPGNYYLLIPSHVSDPSKVNSYPQFEGGPAEYLLVQSRDVSSGGECNMIGTSFEAFARQPDRCAQRRGSCLKRQPVDLWREDMEARIRGKRGKYFVENFGNVPNSPVKTYTNLTGEFLALEYYGEYASTIEIEVKADSNAIVRKGSNAQIPLVYVDGTHPKKTRIILSVLNIGLTSSYFRPRLGDCPPDLDPAWCPLEGPLVTIPPQQRHDFKLDLSGSLPGGQIHLAVQVLNQVNKQVAFRRIIIKRGDRCVCAFHCKCNCLGNLINGRTCRRLSLEEYRKAGYVGPFPFRGGAAASAPENILGNIHAVFLTASYLLFLLGVAKGILGIFCRRIGIAGTRIITGPRELCCYYEPELLGCSVLYDECGFPVHPTTCQPVQIVPLCLEIIINFFFFFLYPLRGIWCLLLSLPCCRTFCTDAEGCCRIEECDQKSSRPLLSKQPNCFHYNLTTVVSKKSKQEYLPFPAYKGDDDPLEEDDTEFVLQEMKRYRKK